MSTEPVRGYLSISEVLAELRADFPDVSVSKIRFLETEGLIAPARSASGYRRFCSQDVDRLRFVLAAQRDQYLPLRVIREQLARLDQQHGARPEAGGPAGAGPAGHGPAGSGGPDSGGPGSGGPGSGGPGSGGGAGLMSAGGRRPDRPAQSGSYRLPASASGPAESEAAPSALTRRELVEAAGVTEALVTELETFGLIQRNGRHYPAEALEVVRTAKALTAFGVEARHLRAVRAAAERETTMIESLVAPILRQRGAGARELAARTARDCAALVLRLHCALVEGTLTEAGLPAGGLGTAAQPAAGEASPDSLRRQARGIEGASA
jgi:DNA-binding transcriptional MerR regulator